MPNMADPNALIFFFILADRVIELVCFYRQPDSLYGVEGKPKGCQMHWLPGMPIGRFIFVPLGIVSHIHIRCFQMRKCLYFFDRKNNIAVVMFVTILVGYT